MAYCKNQNLNGWVKMFDDLYSQTQNYSSNNYEIFSHLAEVTGAFGKFAFKKNDHKKAIEFLPKMFAWSISLFLKVKGNNVDFEDVILSKYPKACPYCLKTPCICWKSGKSIKNDIKLRDEFFLKSKTQKRSVNDFQLMFKNIYEQSWKYYFKTYKTEHKHHKLFFIYSRMIEEISEISEALRFNHLYPTNFENELADYIAWWYALVSSIYLFDDKYKNVLAEDIIWGEYPGKCKICDSIPCDCRPGPVREILSKPALQNIGDLDLYTKTFNHSYYINSQKQIKDGKEKITLPAACIFIDIDNFKNINTEFLQNVGDEAILHVVNILRQKIRLRDKLYRAGGDEFAILCQDLSAEEAYGMMSRIQKALYDKPLIEYNKKHQRKEIRITLSTGIDVCEKNIDIEKAFNNANKAASYCKENGKNQIKCFMGLPRAYK